MIQPDEIDERDIAAVMDEHSATRVQAIQHIQFRRAACAAIPTEPTPEGGRTATVEEDPQHHLPWMVRCWGRGRHVIGTGNLNRFREEQPAREHAAKWIETGA